MRTGSKQSYVLTRALAFCLCLIVLFTCSCDSTVYTQGDAKPAAVTREIRFPAAWVAEEDGGEELLTHVQQLEVRRTPDAAAGEFFFAALPHGDNDYSHELYSDIPEPTYSSNRYAVDFDKNLGVRTVAAAEWGRAKRILSEPRLLFVDAAKGSNEVSYRGLNFRKSGTHWGRVMLSPRGKWLAVFSYTGERRRGNFLGGGEPRVGDVFWDVYDAATGEKVMGRGAKNVEGPASFGGPVAWVEERYVLLPRDTLSQTFLVVTLPEFTPPPNPVTVTLPRRAGDDGKPAPAPTTQEAWTPLAPLTKEQAARITAPSPTRFEEVRRPKNGARDELLLAVRVETENRTRPVAGRDGAGDYNYRQFGTYYYAVAFGDSPRARFISREEWERGEKVNSSRHQVTLEETRDTFGGRRREYRPFPKRGAAWGTPRALTGGGWVAVFSYTNKAEGPGTMFVDIYAGRSGELMVSSQTAYGGPPDVLFGGALWVEGSYLVVPADASFESFQLWTLPGGS